MQIIQVSWIYQICWLDKLGFDLSSEREADPPLLAPSSANGLKAGGDIEVSVTALLCTGPNRKYPVYSKDLAWGFYCQRECSLRHPKATHVVKCQ